MRKIYYFICGIAIITLSNCGCKQRPSEPLAITASSQRLAEIVKNKTADTALIARALDEATVEARNFSSKTHDSLIASSCRQAGNLYLDNKQYEQAGFYYKTGLNHGRRQLNTSDEIMVRLYLNAALAYFNLGDVKMSIKYLDSIHIDSQEKSLLILNARKLERLSTCYYYLKDYKASENLFQKAIPMAKLYLTQQNIAYVYRNYASCLRSVKKYKSSIEAGQEVINVLNSLSKTEKLFRPDSVNLASGYYYIAFALQDSGAYASAENYYKRALDIFKQINDIDNYSVGFLNMGLMFRFAKNLDKAEKTLTEGINILNHEAVLSDYLWVRKGKFYINRSEVFLEKKQYPQALIDQDSAIYYLTKYDKSPSLNALLASNQYSLLSVYSDKAKINILSADNGQDTEGYQKALKLMQQIIQLTNDIRADYFSDDAKLTLANDIKPALEKAISVCQKLYLKTNDKQYLEQAFGFVEYSRSMVLYENARLDNQLPPDLKAENDNLKKLEAALIAKNNVDDLQNYLRLKRQFREKIKALNQNKLATVSELKQTIIKDDKTALIEFFVGDSSVFVFTLTQNDLRLIELKKDVNFEKRINDLRREITQPSPERNAQSFEKQSKILYNALLANTLTRLPTNVNQLIMAPDGVLNYLPFEILIKEDPSVYLANSKNLKDLKNEKTSKNSSFIIHHSSFKKSDFLIKNYQISYAYSANLLLEQKRIEKETAPKLFAGFAAKYADKDTTFAIADVSRAVLTREGAYELKGANEEVKSISNLLGGKAFVDEFATEAAFKKEANQYKILHFAMHSLTDDKDPSLSKLLFTLTPKDTTNDNDLTAAELYATSLKADLAVLSACNTGFGTLNKGEGVMSLARAFTYAGVPSTVTSLWKVPDRETREIMIDFYKNLKLGMTKDAALRQAKLTYLENAPESIAANPYFWAGFVPTGNMEAMDFSERGPLSIKGILVAFLAILGIAFWFYKKRF